MFFEVTLCIRVRIIETKTKFKFLLSLNCLLHGVVVVQQMMDSVRKRVSQSSDMEELNLFDRAATGNSTADCSARFVNVPPVVCHSILL